MIKALIFDVGGVLIRTATRQPRLYWEDKLGLDEWQSEEIVFNSEMGTRAQLGQITNEELWHWVGDRLNLTAAELVDFQKDFWSEDYLDQELVDFICAARPLYQTAIISNATLSLRDTLRYRYPIDHCFDLIVCSAEEGIMKPDRDIYTRTLDRLSVSPAEVVFMDDSKPNVVAAEAIGIKSIHFSVDLDWFAMFKSLGLA